MAQVAGSNKRLVKELADLHNTPLDGISVEVAEDNIYKWTAKISGSNTAYQGGVFELSLEFPIEYPFKTPKVKFNTQIYHPNVDDSGNLCVGLLKAEAWKPSTKASSILMAIAQLLSEPNTDDALVASIAELYKSDRPKFDKMAGEYTKKYASPK
ncbi:unnamed protein product [Tilletia controversa]|uniref:E2 ubiquitin-conjugating enzyme n=2 Tax=Tilletia TaxID=13289 RepID=A0A8X7SUL0_9BASI|nr:hypothetical protein CF336_g5678 [Tilletia laevis]KAE8190538.1 hypothetical protein CF328_g5945 [Tilletia controversa]KAE8254971.1 hypothetical protein A4X03_0g5635 [Tilletia caries]KAE8196172.1 hypothetical protein CF335_g4923 [Tilletia laevis]KAE8242563.1 hypothetical protein A4X06_0g6849 [Tilletia controversa]